MSTNINKKVMEWLHKGGFPLEMRVARELSRANIGANISVVVLDPTTQKEFEIDIIGTLGVPFASTRVEFQLVIECKHSPNEPWIGFASPEAQHHTPWDSVTKRICTQAGHVLLLELSHNGLAKRNRLFQLPSNPCYGVVRAFGNRDEDMVYSAISKAERACHSLALRADEDARRFKLLLSVQIFFPVVITDAPLFACTLDERGEIGLAETDSLVLVRRPSSIFAGHHLVHIIAESHWSVFLDEFRTGWEGLQPFFTNSLPRTTAVIEKFLQSE